MNGIGRYGNRRSKAPLFVTLGCVLLLAGVLAVWLLPAAEGLRGRIAGIFGWGGIQSGEEGLSQEETLSDELIWQSAAAAENDRTAVFTTDAGTFSVKLQPGSAAAEEFAALAQEGAFDGMTIARSVKESYLQTSVVSGSLTAEETGLAPICGATGFVSEDGELSLFFVTADSLSAESTAFLSDHGVGTPVTQLYADRGGVPELSGAGTVFGQVVSGEFLLRTTAAAETSGWTAGYALTAPVTITSVEIVEPVLPEDASSE